MTKKFCIIFSVTFLLSSCIEIIDDIKLNLDGSGTFKYNINLSSSRTKVNSIIALDSLDGRKVPSLDEIKNKVNIFEELLNKQEGITNVQIDKDFNQFIFKVQCDFKSINYLQKGSKNVISQISSDPKINEAKYNCCHLIPVNLIEWCRKYQLIKYPEYLKMTWNFLKWNLYFHYKI